MTGNRSATQMVVSLVEHRCNCAPVPSPGRFVCIYSLTHETKHQTNITLQQKL